MPAKKSSAPVEKKTAPVLQASKVSSATNALVDKERSVFQSVVTLLLVVILILVAMMYKGGSSNNVREEIERIEALKVGGEENFKLFQEVMNHPNQQEQIRQQFDTMLSQLGGEAPAAEANPTPAPSPTGEPTEPVSTITSAQLATVLEDVYVKGNKDSQFVIVEYSDIECPFCARHNTEGTLKQVLDTFGDEVSVVFKHYPLNFHPNAQVAAEATECFAEFMGEENFFNYIDKSFERGISARPAMVALAVELGANEANMNTCLDSGKYTTKVQNNTNEGLNLFGVRGTPGNVIINKETGKRVLVSGAYPTSKFVQEINALKQG